MHANMQYVIRYPITQSTNESTLVKKTDETLPMLGGCKLKCTNLCTTFLIFYIGNFGGS
jgi:hypothetical protein